MLAQPTSPLALHGGTPARSRPIGPIFPGASYIDEAEEAAVLAVLRSGRLFRYHNLHEGPSQAEQLEAGFARMAGVEHALAVNSGTAALICALQGVGVGPGDEVILPAYTWMATATAVLALGGIPVIAEVDESLTLDPVDVAAKITPHTRALLPVHMRGVPANLEALLALAQQHDLALVEDTAQAIGGSYRGKRLGSWGDAGCFSLQLSKIITAGEGGLLITDNESIWRRATLFHDVPAALRQKSAPEEAVWGLNFRMPELSAAVALVQLGRLETLLSRMRAHKRMIKEGLAEIARRKGVTFRYLHDAEGDTGATLVCFLEDSASALRVEKALRAENIGAGLLYHPERPDYHVYAHWTGVMQQRTWTPNGGPWRWAATPPAYDPGMCPRSLEWMGRGLLVSIDPRWESGDVEEIVEGFANVLEAVV